MKTNLTAFRLRLCLCLGLSIVSADAEESGPNLIRNANFENGNQGWNWGQWKGLPEPGLVDTAAPFEGKTSYTFALAGEKGERWLSISIPEIDPRKDYELSLALRGRNLPAKSVSVNLLQWGTEKGPKLQPQSWAWVPPRPGDMKLITAGGTFDWRVFKIHIYRQGIKPSTRRLSLYIRRTDMSRGELGIDAVSFVSVAPLEYRAPARRPRPVAPMPVSKTPPKKLVMQKEALPAGQVLLLDRCDQMEGWSLNTGREFPGARGNLAVVEERSRSVIRVEYDLGKGRYVGAQRTRTVPEAKSLIFSINGFRPLGFNVRVRDATGQTHSTTAVTHSGDWEEVEVPLTRKGFSSHWGGAKDGKIHFPLQSILIAFISARGGAGHFLLRDLGVRTIETGQTWLMNLTTSAPGHIHFSEESSIALTASMTNRLRVTRQATAEVRIVDVEGQKIASEIRKFEFQPWETKPFDLTLPSPGPGYFAMEMKLSGGESFGRASGAFAVVPRPVRFGQRDPASFFAMHVSDPAAAARIGVHWSRAFNFWRYSESRPGRYTHKTDYVKRCLEAGLDVMMCLDYREPSWLKPPVDAEGLPTKEALRHYADFVRDAVRSHPEVAVFEIQNEPNGELGYGRNLPIDKAIEFYVQLVHAAAPIIRREAPASLVCGCTVSGGDYAGFPFSGPALASIGHFIDIFGAHPYASPRTFGPGLRSAFPEENREEEKHRAALTLLQTPGSPKQMWIGEKGWAIRNETPLFGPVSLSYADCLARSLIIAKSVSGIGKYFWFMQTQEFGGGKEKYAIFRGQPSSQPMPGAVAYATVAHQLDHARPEQSFSFSGGFIRACVFKRTEANKAVAAVWSTRKPFLLKAKLPPDARAIDLYGRTVDPGQIKAGSSPVFIQTPLEHLDALVGALGKGDWIPGEPFEVVRASLENVRSLRVGLVNQTGRSLPVVSLLDGKKRRLVLPQISETTWLQFRLDRPADQRNARFIKLSLAAEDARAVEVAVPGNLLPVVRSRGIQLDGRSDDWKGVPEIVVNTRDKILPPDPAGWTGPEDLSARARIAWDHEHLYLLIVAADDKHVIPNLQAYWISDSVQVAVDMKNNAFETPGYDEDDREFGILVAEDGAHVYQSFPKGATAHFRAAGRRTEKETIYEAAIPWPELGRAPSPGMVFSLNFILNENDGSGRKFWMGLTPGIGEGKRPGVYRDFYLRP